MQGRQAVAQIRHRAQVLIRHQCPGYHRLACRLQGRGKLAGGGDALVTTTLIFSFAALPGAASVTARGESTVCALAAAERVRAAARKMHKVCRMPCLPFLSTATDIFRPLPRRRGHKMRGPCCREEQRRGPAQITGDRAGMDGHVAAEKLEELARQIISRQPDLRAVCRCDARTVGGKPVGDQPGLGIIGLRRDPESGAVVRQEGVVGHGRSAACPHLHPLLPVLQHKVSRDEAQSDWLSVMPLPVRRQMMLPVKAAALLPLRTTIPARLPPRIMLSDTSVRAEPSSTRIALVGIRPEKRLPTTCASAVREMNEGRPAHVTEMVAADQDVIGRGDGDVCTASNTVSSIRLARGEGRKGLRSTEKPVNFCVPPKPNPMMWAPVISTVPLSAVVTKGMKARLVAGGRPCWRWSRRARRDGRSSSRRRRRCG